MINFLKNLIQRPEKLFLIFVLFWGMILVFVNPPFQNFDEPEHFYKIYAISDGTLNFKKITSYTDGIFYFDKPKTFTSQVVPISIVQLVVHSKRMNPYFDENKIYNEGTKTSLKEIISSSHIKLDKHLKTIIIHPIPFSIFSYMLSSSVLFLLKTADVNPLYMMYILRLCSLFLYTGLIYYAIKIIPVKKYLLLFLGLMPTSLYLAGAINTDHITIGLCYFYTAYVLKLAFSEKIQTISKTHIAALSLLIFFISVNKFVYAPLVLLFFVIPKAKFSSQKLRLLYFSGLFILSSTSALCLIFYVMHISQGTFSYYSTQNPYELLLNTIHHPVNYLCILLKTLLFYGSTYIKNSISDFGFSDTNLPSLIIYFYLFLLTLVSLDKQNTEYKIDTKTKALFLFIFVSSIFFTFFIDYLNFELEPGGYIAGFKGRYLIPVYPFLFFVFYNSKLKFEKLNLNFVTLIYLIFFLCAFITAILFRYYDLWQI